MATACYPSVQRKKDFLCFVFFRNGIDFQMIEFLPGNGLWSLFNTVSEDTLALSAMEFFLAPPYTMREIDIFDGNKAEIAIVVERLYAQSN